MELIEKLSYLVKNFDKLPKQMFVDSHDRTGESSNKNSIMLYDHYESDRGSYEGSGERILIEDGKLKYGFDSHCSCNMIWGLGDYKGYEDNWNNFKNSVHAYTGKDHKPQTGNEYKEFEFELNEMVNAFGEEIEKGVTNAYDAATGKISVETYKQRVLSELFTES